MSDLNQDWKSIKRAAKQAAWWTFVLIGGYYCGVWLAAVLIFLQGKVS